ncbi:MAG: ATP-binding protein [Bacteroides sp.]|nr:ATP-binding protein [Bacteroides sp.]MCM1085458.1 ATP-binding protein [Bacteroides sp.]
MKFFDRKQEIRLLREIRKQVQKQAQFTVLTGRRRIGKTSLVWKAYEDMPFLYFFVSRKTESELCETYQAEISGKLGVPTIGKAQNFAEVFEFLLKWSVSHPLTLFIDEFQEFYRVNKSVYGDMQRLWDLYHTRAHVNLIVCGSVHSMMSRIFMDGKEPLYNRQTRFMSIRPFTPSVLKEILKSHNGTYTPEDLLALYSFTGGVAKYVQLLMDAGATTKAKMIRQILRPDSVFTGEGKAMLVEEFGREYGIYFSILSAIAQGKNSRAEIENAVGRETGGYLTRLETEYELIGKKQPLFEKNSNKNMRYVLKDNFLTFWFRFIYKYGYMLEIEAFDALKTLVNRDYETFSGLMLERYFRQVLAESGKYTRIGGWWNRKGENEIDLIAENELTREACFFEIKRNADRYNPAVLEEKVAKFLQVTGQFKGYTVSRKVLSMKDM